jgi:RNA polymerase sigma factor (sigma-70 family)
MRTPSAGLYSPGQPFREDGVVADPLHNLLSHLHRAVGAPDGDSDSRLLERFVRKRDATAFELIVWRHERLVRGVCRRLLGDGHDADDAFQATFLVLVRKAASVGKGAALASWLYKVASRCALRLRARTARRNRRQAHGVDVAALPAPEVPAREEAIPGPLLDEEIQALPEKYRAPLVLCYLEGLTYDQAARQLGCPKGTVSTRLTKARDLLRGRLLRRGVNLSPVALVGILCERPSSAAPLGLVPLVARSAGAAAGAVPARVAAIVEGVLRSMFLARIKPASVLLLLVALGTGAGALLYQGRAEPPAGDRPPSTPAADGEAVYRQFFTRTDQEGKLCDQEELEPPFAPGSKFLLDGESHRRALAVLDELLTGEPEKKMTPLERAVLQHDLWAVLATTAGDVRPEIRADEITGRISTDTSRYQDEGDSGLAHPRQRRELQKRLAQAMRRLALSPRAIAALPDNLADAI